MTDSKNRPTRVPLQFASKQKIIWNKQQGNFIQKVKWGLSLFSTEVIIHRVYPQNFYITIVCNFSWIKYSRPRSSQEKSKSVVMQNFGRETWCIMVSAKRVNSTNSKWMTSFKTITTLFTLLDMFPCVSYLRQIQNCINLKNCLN